MFPVLISVGSFTFYTFNLFVILGLIVALYVVWKKAREEAEDEEKVLDISLLAIVFGLLGGRIVEGIFSWRVFGVNIYKLLAFWIYPGFSVWGAFGAAALALFWICKKRHLDLAKVLDYLACGLAVFLPFLFLGHIFAGSYFGRETQFFWGISIPGLLGRRHPTAIIGFIVSLLILFVAFRFSAKKHFYGATTLVFLSLFSLLTFAIEWLRGDSLYLDRRIENLIISAAVFGLSSSLFYFKSERNIRKDLSLTFTTLGKFLGKLVSGTIRLKKFIPKKRKKIWQIPETHYKM